MSDAPDSPGVVVPPPLIYATAIVLGLLLRRVWPMRFLPDHLAALLGPAVVVAAVGLVLAAIGLFRRAGTRPEPWRPTTAIVVSGPYRFTRNPMYVAMALVVIGAGVWANTLWPLLLLPAVLPAIDRGVIAREERYLERKFGEEYRAYKSRVRRWL